MPHLHNKPGQHDFTSSAFIVRTDTPEPTLLLHWHKKLNQYLQFGGHVEHDEDLWQAVIHELQEESGYTIDQLSILQPPLRIESMTGIKVHPVPIYMMTHPFVGMDHYHDDIAFAFVTNQAPAATVAEGESTQFTLFTAQELRAIPTEKIPENVREAGLFILKNYLSHWQPVACTRSGALCYEQ